MNKDILVLLLQRDIKELSLLTEGFEEMDKFPESLLRLAIGKGENILQSLKELENSVLPELGAIDYESFEDEDEDNEERGEEIFFEEKNIFDAPLDSELEPPVNPHEIEMDAAPIIAPSETSEEDKSEQYMEKEHELSKAADASEIVQSEPEMNDESNEELVESLIGAEVELSDEEVVEEVDVDEEEELESEPESESESESESEFETISNEEDSHPETVHPHTTLNDTLSNEDNSLSNNLANQKIDDIRSAINIGDRFRFQRELFGGNGEVLNKTLNYLNQLSKFSEAESFLKSKFGWGNDNVHAEEFLQIVKRRYL